MKGKNPFMYMHTKCNFKGKTKVLPCFKSSGVIGQHSFCSLPLPHPSNCSVINHIHNLISMLIVWHG